MISTRKKILVVDDTEATRYAIARTLRAAGYDIVEAINGTEALRLVQSEHPDLVTLDIHLPDIIGFEVCRRIKLNPVSSHIPVLQVSASFVTSKDRIHGLEGGADSYLTHPFEPAVLLATVKALLRSRQVNENLRLAEEKFRVALKHAPIMIYTTDRELNYTWIYNPPEGFTVDEVLKKTDSEIYPAADARMLQEKKQQVLDSGVGLQWIHIFDPAWKFLCYDITIEPLNGEDHEIVGLTVACIDISDRVRAEEAQKQAYQAAELANQAKTRFLSNMSHEIRTPLGVIQGFADLALDPSLSEHERNNYLSIIKKNAKNLTSLIGDILDLSKVEAGKLEIEKSQFSLVELLNDVVETMSLRAREKGLTLTVAFSPNFPRAIVTDITRVRQILLNLLSNAIKFSEKGLVEISITAPEKIYEAEPVLVRIAVRDTGIGLTAEQKGRLFEAFMQADSSTTRKFGGTGLGLNLSKKLAQSLGGDLELSSSEINVGSTFTLTFPAGHAAEEQSTSQVSQADWQIHATPQLRDMKVLLADDSKDNQVLISLYLKRMGISVDFANDGREAVEQARNQHYDVVLMDIQMPYLDGHEATQILRAEGYKTPIIALTAHALKEERTLALRQGFNAYLTKPLDAKMLFDTLENICLKPLI